MISTIKTVLKEHLKESKSLKRRARLLKREFYAKTIGYPNWEKIIKANNPSWKDVVEASKGGPKVLIATSIGAHLAGITLESLIGAALMLRGAEIHVLLCDAALPACLDCQVEWYPWQEHFVTNGPQKDLCKHCFYPAKNMYRSLGVTVHRFSEFLTQNQKQQAEELSKTMPFEDIGNYHLDGLAVGEHTLAGALRFFARGSLDGELYGEQIIRRYFNASLLSTFTIINLLKRYNFSSALFHHGIYVPQGLIGEVCRKQGVHVVNWNPAYRKKCFIFSHLDTYHHTMMTEPVGNWVNIPWNEKLESKLLDYLKSRWKGTQDWIWFHEKPKFELEEIAAQTGIDFSKPCIGLLTSVMWDAVLHYPSNAFSSMLEWIQCTIDYFVKRPDLQLVIRIHPAELRGTLPSRQRIGEEINKFYPELPPNIFVILPESDISTYAVMSQCDSVIIYNTKTGVELSAIGIPVIVAGEAWIRNKGFAIDVDNPESYDNILNRLPFKQCMNDEDVLKAKKYAYHFFFHRMIPLDFMEPRKADPPFTIKLDSLKKLEAGANKGLDVICDGILNGADFIYTTETSSCYS